MVAGLAFAGIAATGAGAQTETDPGVSAKAVKLGYIFPETGVASSTFKNAGKACQARIDRENANGGVNGRKIDMEIVDDASSGANLTSTQDLVENRDVFAIVNNSSFAFLSYRYMLEQGVPMIGGGFDGTYYTQKGNEDIISALGSGTPFPGLSYTTTPKVMKELGAKKVATLAYGASASSTASAKTLMDYAVPAVGLDPVYTNTSVEFGTSDVGPLVLGIKNSGADAAYLPIIAASNIAVVQGLQQNGVEMKANILATGYGQEFLDSPVAKTLKPNTVFVQSYKPVEVKSKGTKQFQADLKKYAGLTGVPDYGQYTGYITCNLAILGLLERGEDAHPPGLHRRPPQARLARRSRPDLPAGRHQRRRHRYGTDDELRVLHVREGREVRRHEQGQALHRQARRLEGGPSGQRGRRPLHGHHDRGPGVLNRTHGTTGGIVRRAQLADGPFGTSWILPSPSP